MTPPTGRRTFLKGAAGAAAAFALEPSLLATPPRLSAKVKIGLVGAGRQGRAIVGELAKFDDVELTAICDTDARRLKGVARRAPEAKACASWDELVSGSPDLDAIIVATPTHAHREVALAAIAADKHVFCEAPLASTLDDCRAIAKAARASQKVFQTGFQGRANPVYRLAYSFVRTGALRDVVTMRGQHHVKNQWKTPTDDPARDRLLNWRLDPERSLGLTGEVGAQQFDVFHWFTGRYPTSVRARGANLAWNDGRKVADTVWVDFVWPDGQRLAWEGTVGNSYGGTYEVLAGTMGTVKLAWSHGWMFKEADSPTFDWEVYANRQQFHNDEGITLIADATQLASQGKLKEGIGLPHPALYYALESFLKSATEGEKIVCSAEEGLRATAVAIRAHEALRSGDELAITEELFKID